MTYLVRRRPVAILVLLIALAAGMNVIPMASPAAAHNPQPTNPCHAGIRGLLFAQEIGDNVWLIWECQELVTPGRFRWVPIGIEHIATRRSVAGHRTFAKSTPPYRMYVDSLLGDGTGGGIGVAALELRHPNETALSRRLSARIIMRYWNGSSWIACHDTNWHEAPSARSTWEFTLDQFTQPDCGTGWYEVRAGGRFFATSLNRWEFPGWVFSGQLFLDGGGTVSDTPPPPPPPDTEPPPAS